MRSKPITIIEYDVLWARIFDAFNAGLLSRKEASAAIAELTSMRTHR